MRLSGLRRQQFILHLLELAFERYIGIPQAGPDGLLSVVEATRAGQVRIHTVSSSGGSIGESGPGTGAGTGYRL